MNLTVPAVDHKTKHWHPDIHFRLHEYVRYVRVSLNSQYTTEQFFESLRKICRKWNVENFTVLEVYGTHDRVIRIFSKQERPFTEDFKAWIETPAPKMKATQTQWGDYGKCLHYWLWAEKALALSNIQYYTCRVDRFSNILYPYTQRVFYYVINEGRWNILECSSPPKYVMFYNA